MGDGMRMDPSAVAAVGHRLGSTTDALRRAVDDAATARFGPHAVGPDLREHGVAYAAGMRELAALVESMAESVTGLVDRFDSATVALTSTDVDIAKDIRSAGGST